MRAGDFTKCKGCGKGMMHTGLPLFWRVKIERMGIDGRAVQQTDAIEALQDFGRIQNWWP